MLPDLRPRGVGEILDAAVALYRARWATLMRLITVVVLPVQVLSVLVQLSTEPESDPSGLSGLSGSTAEPGGEGFWLQLAGSLAVMIAGLLATSFATAAVTRVAADTYLGDSADARASVRLATGRLGAVIGLGLLTALSVALGFLFCLLPGIWLQISWAVATPALLLEGLGVGAALRRSFELTKTRWWQCFAVFWLGSMLQGAVAFGLAMPLGWALDPLAGDAVVTAVGGGLAATLAAVVTMPFLATSLVALYFDLRIRAEGFDIAVALHRLDTAAGHAVAR